MDTLQQIRLIWKPFVFLLCLAPAVLVVTDLFEITGALGANPVEAMQDRFGTWGIRFIMLTLAVTPLRKLTGWNWLTRFRRMLGLFTFFYVLLHFAVWLMLEQSLYFLPWRQVLPTIIEDITKRPYITLGFTALLVLIAMAITSTAGMRRRMGPYWQKLHYGAYAVGLLGVWHYWWQVKKGPDDAIYYAAIFAVLMGLRIYYRRKGAQPFFRKRALPPKA
ncbi:MAG: sulfoxide reductase heme-binding subunit YedZ [Proteobacteria bacterium]|nr:sulfoxide reductase heme-binding subunit YedZ [Pseudomonadota bacterium]MDA1064774.1 sulfoxide reductase heme-binding subunit YedZ [Pseudomonadota bacterium]